MFEQLIIDTCGDVTILGVTQEMSIKVGNSNGAALLSRPAQQRGGDLKEGGAGRGTPGHARARQGTPLSLITEMMDIADQRRIREEFKEAVMRAELGDPDPEPLFWDKTHPSQADEDYTSVVVYCGFSAHGEVFDERRRAIFRRMFQEEFNLTHPLRWIGVVKTFKTPGVPNTGGRLDAFFLVHREDTPKISNGHRIDLGFSWFFDAVQPGTGGLRLYPREFGRMYRDV